MIRLDQFDIQRIAHMEESQLGACGTGLTVEFPMRFFDAVRQAPLGLFHTEEVCKGLRGCFNIVDDKPDLGDDVRAENSFFHRGILLLHYISISSF